MFDSYLDEVEEHYARKFTKVLLLGMLLGALLMYNVSSMLRAVTEIAEENASEVRENLEHEGDYQYHRGRVETAVHSAIRRHFSTSDRRGDEQHGEDCGEVHDDATHQPE